MSEIFVGTNPDGLPRQQKFPVLAKTMKSIWRINFASELSQRKHMLVNQILFMILIFFNLNGVFFSPEQVQE